jgi:pSer/pThr/pTyr-binding forkhead associated (FHA) protein
VLLSDLERPPEGILYYEGTGNGKSMRLEETTTVIGSDDHLAACIPSATVSRRHARITREGDTYWLEDLNSANGTYLDGKILAYKERKELCPNQSVRFADETYRFL